MFLYCDMSRSCDVVLNVADVYGGLNKDGDKNGRERHSHGIIVGVVVVKRGDSALPVLRGSMG
jgi:hypothetical protein